jgi:predicted  nucleic acid-binding Zn-ribbon protein
MDRLQAELFSIRQRDTTSSLERQKVVQLEQRAVQFEQRTVQYESRVREYELRISEYESEMSASRQEEQQLRGSLDEYEKRIVMLSMEMERLNSVLKKGSPTKQDPS